jgi:hypothetical protein
MLDPSTNRTLWSKHAHADPGRSITNRQQGRKPTPTIITTLHGKPDHLGYR